VRNTPVFLRALAALALFLPVPARSDPSRELIVHRGPVPLGVSAAADDARLDARLEALALVRLRRLDEGLPIGAGRTAEPPGPFDLDPSRILLVAASDSAAATAARIALMTDPGVVWVEPNHVRGPAILPPGYPDDPFFTDTRQWGLRNLGPSGVLGGIAGADIHAPEAWASSVGGNNVRLAVADTGVDPQHPELQVALPGGGWRMELGINVTGEPTSAWADTFGHGTPVAGVMAARTHEGVHLDSLGMAGVCGGDGGGNIGCRLVPIKISPGRTGTASSFDISRAMLYAASVGARAMNISFAGGGPSRLERLAMYHAITHGCVVVAAAGNRGHQAGAQPAQYPAAYASDGLGIQVGASDPWDRRAGWSSFGPGLDLLAPGADIWSCLMTYPFPGNPPHPPYAAVSGTSFAAPFVTGTIGLLAARRPELADTDFQHILRESADDVGAPGVDAETGWGRLNAAAALAAVDSSLAIWHDEVPGAEFTSDGIDTLTVGEPGPGAMGRLMGPVVVERFAATATVTLPDSFAGPVRVWPRIGGTFTCRPAFQMPYWTPWAEVVAQDQRSFTLRGWLFRVIDGCSACGGESWLPLPPDQARFGFTVLGTVRRGAPPVGVGATPAVARLVVRPAVFRSLTTIFGPAGARITIVDVSGRVVRRAVLDGTMGALPWDGTDERGRQVRPGLYFVRCDRPAGSLLAKVVRLE
jgi:subtilisin family serine protease